MRTLPTGRTPCAEPPPAQRTGPCRPCVRQERVDLAGTAAARDELRVVRPQSGNGEAWEPWLQREASIAVTPAWPRAGAACAVPTALVAIERVHSGAHCPSDVAVGAAIGLSVAALTRSVPRLAVRHPGRAPADEQAVEPVQVGEDAFHEPASSAEAGIVLRPASSFDARRREPSTCQGFDRATREARMAQREGAQGASTRVRPSAGTSAAKPPA
ncbi:phosphatase PAP2 family protein [Streptomyces cinereoruber]|uniref:phosphatase PAP2 family protein n=1 Tax=Streptomyces cinereoruber TaxID=67260 RepID=UPI0036364974